MDFLETNFKGQKIPKRSIRPTNVAGQSINVNLKKYALIYFIRLSSFVPFYS